MIRPLQMTTDSDRQAVLEVQREAYAVEAALIGFDDIPPRFDTAESLLGSDEMFYGSFTEDGRLQGLVAIEKNTHSVRISRLAVHPDHFRQGIGEGLIRYLEETFSWADAMAVSTGAGNEPAIRLYRKLGFEPVGRREVEEGLVLIQMEKRR